MHSLKKSQQCLRYVIYSDQIPYTSVMRNGSIIYVNIDV